LVPLVVSRTDYFLTMFVYHYAFNWTNVRADWAWYVMAMRWDRF